MRTEVEKNKNLITDVYLVGGIAVDIAQIGISCMESQYKKTLNTGVNYQFNKDENWHKKSFNKIPKSRYDSLIYYYGVDGLYTTAVGVNFQNQVKKIFVECQVSEYTNFKNNRGHCEKKISGSVHQSYPLNTLIYNDQFFSHLKAHEKLALIREKVSNPVRIKLLDLKIESGFIFISDQPPLWNSEFDEKGKNDTEKSEILKNIREKYQNESVTPIDYEQAVPVNNGTYPVYAYCYNEDKYSEFSTKFVKIVIEDIEGCYLNKNSKGEMIFERNFMNSYMIERVQKKQYKIVAIDKIDLRNTKSLVHVKDLRHVEKLTLKNLNNFTLNNKDPHYQRNSWDVSPLSSLTKLKKLTLDNCDMSLHVELAKKGFIKPKIDRFGQYKVKDLGYIKKTYEVY